MDESKQEFGPAGQDPLPVSRTSGECLVIGNASRAEGASERLTLLMERILEGETEALTRRLVEVARKGDMEALRLTLEHLTPPQWDVSMPFEVQSIGVAEGVQGELPTINSALFAGKLIPGGAGSAISTSETHKAKVETGDLERRLAAIEENETVKRKELPRQIPETPSSSKLRGHDT